MGQSNGRLPRVLKKNVVCRNNWIACLLNQMGFKRVIITGYSRLFAQGLSYSGKTDFLRKSRYTADSNPTGITNPTSSGIRSTSISTIPVWPVNKLHAFASRGITVNNKVGIKKPDCTGRPALRQTCTKIRHHSHNHRRPCAPHGACHNGDPATYLVEQ